MTSLLLIGAVPFSLGPTPLQQANNASTRPPISGRRRHPAGNLVLPALPASDNTPDLYEILRSPEGAGFVSVGLHLAGRSLGAQDDAAINTPPGPPPNSPANMANNSSQAPQQFVFPEVEDDSSSSDCLGVTSHQQKCQRKRRRIPSFNRHHRVAPKLQCSDDDDADDEDSDFTAEKSRAAADANAGSADASEAYDSDAEARQELSLRLRILAESQKSGSDTDWSKVGEELRSIADSFQTISGSASTEGRRTQGQSGQAPVAPSGEVVPTDFLSFINLLLPVSIPQSLWSAIASYVAWKILKRL